jgi:hypothetical protein
MIVTVFEWLGDHVAEIIAACALVFTAYQVTSQRRHNVLSVRPHITTFTHRNKDATFARLDVQLLNNGLGPAFVHKFQVYLSGQPCEANAALNQVLGGLARNSTTTILGDDYAMPPNETRTILSVRFPIGGAEDVDAVEEKLNKLDLEVDYSSAYGESFTYDTRESHSM